MPLGSAELGRRTFARRRGKAPILVGLVDRSGDAVTVRLAGALVRGTEQVVKSTWTEAALGSPLGRPAGRVVLDLSALERWDLVGLAAILAGGARAPAVEVTGADAELANALAKAMRTWRIASPHVDRTRQHLAGESPESARLPEWLGNLGDAALALIALVVLAPLLVLIAAAIAIDSPGPIFFLQERSGRLDRNGRLGIVRVCKFRTMVTGAESQRSQLRAANRYGDGAFFKIVDDPRVTRIGKHLRSWSLDELPQLVNVVKGEMRLVGNRPLPLDEAEALREEWQRVRFAAPVGLTGLWQVSGRSELEAEMRMAMDTAYAVGRSPRENLAILLQTIPVLWHREGR
ncbi:MAG: sugar transferase [Cyanobacteria bacterium REEB65]|nr:sugar transferase [Cyanobacteria bacterium REEB65]